MYHETINFATKDYPFLVEHTDVKYIPHFHNEPEIVYVIEGKVNVTIENNTHTITEGDICIFTPCLIHNLYSYESSKTFVMKLFPSPYLGNIQLYNNIIHPCDEVYDKLLETIKCIMTENKAKNTGYELCVNICAEKIFLLIIRNMKYLKLKDTAQIKLANKSEFLNSITAFLEQHYAEDFTLEEVAKHHNYTKSYFCHYFKHITGVTFWRYYTIFRLEKSLKLMKEYPEKKLIEISSTAGFKNIRSFNQSFKEYHHCTPREYIKKYYTENTFEL